MTSKKIALISAGVSKREYPQFERFMPMTAVGLHYIKADLEREHYNVKIINQTNDCLTNIKTANEIDDYNPDFLLFNQFFSTRDRIRDEIITNLKGNYIIGVGGHDATFHSRKLSLEELTKHYSQFDFIWQGETENQLGKFLRIFQKQKKPQIINNLKNRIQILDDLPILKHDDYKGDVGFLSTSRGCLKLDSCCDFCSTGIFYPTGWKARSIEHVIPELENLSYNGKKYVFVTDDNFLGFSKKDIMRGNKIIESASNLGLKLMIMTTKEQIIKAENIGYLSNWQGKVFRTFLGIENGSRESALNLGKSSAKHNNYSNICKKAISLLYKNGIALFGGYINFNPITTIKELEKSIIFLRDNGREAANFTNLSQGLRFYDGTKICEKYPEQAKNHKIKDGEFFYKFKHQEVQNIYEHLSQVKKLKDNLIERLDNFNYEITDLIYLNQIQNTNLGKKYFKITDQRNQLNANYFLDLCKKAKEKRKLDTTQDKFILKSERLEIKYQEFYKNIKKSVQYY